MTASPWQIRCGTMADLPVVESIERASFSDPWSTIALAQELEPSPLRLPLVAQSAEGEVAGYLMAWRSHDQLHILNLAVAPAQRRQKVASLLLAAAISEARGQGLSEVTLEVRPGNAAARQLYRTFGFRPAGRRIGYYPDTGEDALILTLALPDS